MFRKDSQILYSATDLVNYLACEHHTTLEINSLFNELKKAPESEEDRLIKKAGNAHEERYLEILRSKGINIRNIKEIAKSHEERCEATLSAMHQGVEIIYQAAFQSGKLIGYADFLRRVPVPSNLGDYSYEVMDTKLARSERGKFVVQLSCYAFLLEKIQDTLPHHLWLILGNLKEVSYRTLDYIHYFQHIKARFETFLTLRPKTKAEPCTYCDHCHWQSECETYWQKVDHLSLVANISRLHRDKLYNQGINTLKDLAALPIDSQFPQFNSDVLQRLIHQAKLQYQAREDGQKHLELIPQVTDDMRGFKRLPPPNPGDLYFDMEGDPIEEGGLEYLFGLYFKNISGNEEFKAFWGHNRYQEKLAFEDFIDFVMDHLAIYPEAHIYHYAAYEKTALRKLMTLHGTRESEVDFLLREGKLVDLYQVVRESLRVSEPSYSIKYIEKFYLKDEDLRKGDVKNASASIVAYEKWRETQDPKILEEIESYNKDDVRSTMRLHQWLLELKPDTVPFKGTHKEAEEKSRSEKAIQWEQKLSAISTFLTADIPEDEPQQTPEQKFKLLLSQLADFYRRSEKPVWWAYFDRLDETDIDILMEDAEYIYECQEDPNHPKVSVKNSYLYTFTYKDQPIKLKSGDSVVSIPGGITLNNFTHDPEKKKITFTVNNKKEIPSTLHITTGQPISTEVIRDGLLRYIDSEIEVLKNPHNIDPYPAITQLLKRQAPRIDGLEYGSNLISNNLESSQEKLTAIIQVVKRLNTSTLFIQGPPGTGKTYVGSKIIVELLKSGNKIAIASNSHKAIHNLLERVEREAVEQHFEFIGIKKSSGTEESEFTGQFIKNISDNKKIIGSEFVLLAGTAWLFSREDLNQHFDYLIIDEAGQVSLANFIAMATCAKNILLLGDQMQLNQPIQGTHPGDSGMSCLEYLLKGDATISPHMGLFLDTTYRMNPQISEFISESIYDSRLISAPSLEKQQLIPLQNQRLPTQGISCIPIAHQGCSQYSKEEANWIKGAIEELLTHSYQDKEGQIHKLNLDDILVVTPYNQQVLHLRTVLPEGTQIGTVDKFQGQEAMVVIVSMVTSSAEYMPRNIDFLFSKNRLNVALTRAKALSLLVFNPELLDTPCNTPDQMALVDMLCWLWQEYGVKQNETTI